MIYFTQKGPGGVVCVMPRGVENVTIIPCSHRLKNNFLVPNVLLVNCIRWPLFSYLNLFFTHLSYLLDFIFVFHHHVMGGIPPPSRGSYLNHKSQSLLIIFVHWTQI